MIRSMLKQESTWTAAQWGRGVWYLVIKCVQFVEDRPQGSLSDTWKISGSVQKETLLHAIRSEASIYWTKWCLRAESSTKCPVPALFQTWWTQSSSNRVTPGVSLEGAPWNFNYHIANEGWQEARVLTLQGCVLSWNAKCLGVLSSSNGLPCLDIPIPASPETRNGRTMLQER